MVEKTGGKAPRKPRSGIVNFAGENLLCLETYQTLKRRLFDDSGFLEVTAVGGFKVILNKDSIQTLEIALEKPEEAPKKEGKR